MKKAICFLFLIICTSNLFSQTKIEDYLEGRKFKNAATGLVLQYGYISSLNTNGITYTNGYGDKFYFMNCSKRVSSDETYMVLTECMNPQNGSGLGTIYAYRTKVIVKASDGQLEYDLVGESDFSTQSQNKEEKESKSNSTYISPKSKIVPSTIIGKSIKIGKLQIASNDFPEKLDWNDAKKACIMLGNGWRLPTKDELNIIYQNKDKIGGFADSDYWSSTESTNSNYAGKQALDIGSQAFFNKNDKLYVRAIRAF